MDGRGTRPRSASEVGWEGSRAGSGVDARSGGEQPVCKEETLVAGAGGLLDADGETPEAFGRSAERLVRLWRGLWRSMTRERRTERERLIWLRSSESSAL